MHTHKHHPQAHIQQHQNTIGRVLHARPNATHDRYPIRQWRGYGCLHALLSSARALRRQHPHPPRRRDAINATERRNAHENTTCKYLSWDLPRTGYPLRKCKNPGLPAAPARGYDDARGAIPTHPPSGCPQHTARGGSPHGSAGWGGHMLTLRPQKLRPHRHQAALIYSALRHHHSRSPKPYGSSRGAAFHAAHWSSPYHSAAAAVGSKPIHLDHTSIHSSLHRAHPAAPPPPSKSLPPYTPRFIHIPVSHTTAKRRNHKPTTSCASRTRCVLRPLSSARSHRTLYPHRADAPSARALRRRHAPAAGGPRTCNDSPPRGPCRRSQSSRGGRCSGRRTSRSRRR